MNPKIYKSIVKIFNYNTTPQNRFTEVANNYNEFQLEELAGDITEHFKSSIDLIDNISASYGFKYLVLWQPTMYTEEKITEEEKTIDPRLDDESANKLFNYVNHMLQRENIPYFYNISDVVKNRNETIYIDFFHLSEKGNKLVAERIYTLIEKEFLLNK